jgi:hypothetical protein
MKACCEAAAPVIGAVAGVAIILLVVGLFGGGGRIA